MPCMTASATQRSGRRSGLVVLRRKNFTDASDAAYGSPIIASASISTSISGETKPLTSTMVAAGRRRTATDTAHDLATRLGGITQRLHATGAGVAAPVDAQRLCEIVHAAYNPRAAEVLEEARASGEPAQLHWGDVGPAAADARAESYWHDGAVSVTWAMSQAPRRP